MLILTGTGIAVQRPVEIEHRSRRAADILAARGLRGAFRAS
jgi:hypothetical protein